MSAPRKIEKPLMHKAPRTVRGRILEVDWKDGTAELHTPAGVIRMEFAEDRAEDLRRFATRYVEVKGVADLTEDGDVRALAVETIESTLDDDSFWRPLSPDELIRAQGIRPYTFPEPLDDGDLFDVDEFLAMIFGDRRAP